MFSQRTSRKNCWMTPCSIGPRQITGASSPVRKAIETSWIPYCSAGMILPRSSLVSWVLMPSMIGTLGP